jgi:RNA polymerase sigma factor (sigma-70 family)
MRREGPRGRRIRRGSAADAGEDDFERLFWRYGTSIHAYLSRRAGRQEADDLLEEVWVRAFRSQDRYDARLSAPAWLYGIARNVLLGHFRAQGSCPNGHLDRREVAGSDVWGDVDDRLDAGRTASALAEALATLSEGDREVLLLVAWEQLTPGEVAAVLNIPQGTARSRLHRARTQIRGHLEAAGWPTHPESIPDSRPESDPVPEACDDRP